MKLAVIEIVRPSNLPFGSNAGDWEVWTANRARGNSAEMSKKVFQTKEECELWLAALGMELAGEAREAACDGRYWVWPVREVLG